MLNFFVYGDSRLGLPLTSGTIAAALPGKNLPTIRKKLLERPYVLIVNIPNSLPAETTLGLLPNNRIESSSAPASRFTMSCLHALYL